MPFGNTKPKKYTEHITIHLTPEQKKRLYDQCPLMMPFSEFVRNLALYGSSKFKGMKSELDISN